MANAYPMALRMLAVTEFESGKYTGQEVAEKFGISLSSLSLWMQRWRRNGSVEPTPKAGGWYSQIDVNRLLNVVYAFQGATTDELTRIYNCDLPSALRVHRSSILRTLKREGFVFKKNVRGPLSKTDQM